MIFRTPDKNIISWAENEHDIEVIKDGSKDVIIRAVCCHHIVNISTDWYVNHLEKSMRSPHKLSQ